MRALIMAAGLGTRLRPLTDNLPKPLVPVLGRPMIEYVLENLARAGVSEALVNVHYLPEKMKEFVLQWNKRGGRPRLHIQDESEEILGSGGAISKGAAWLFESDRAAIVCNSDVLGKFDLRAMLTKHQKLHATNGVECTLTVMKHEEAGKKFNGLRRKGDLVVAFEKSPDPDLWIFPGYYVIEVSALSRMPRSGEVFSIVDKLWKPLAEEAKLGAWEHNGTYYDLGTVADLKAAEAALAKS